SWLRLRPPEVRAIPLPQVGSFFSQPEPGHSFGDFPQEGMALATEHEGGCSANQRPRGPKSFEHTITPVSPHRDGPQVLEFRSDFLAKLLALLYELAPPGLQPLYFGELTQSRSFLSSATVSLKGSAPARSSLRKTKNATTAAMI